ncbi:uncharacterized protein Fot_37313 [Forsythia ovata]|uniref:Uncharacterized protein n=1 Tax=Forsythia ovata TaxID=205694 RepID=A0ABD1RYM7_9LAMI
MALEFFLVVCQICSDGSDQVLKAKLSEELLPISFGVMSKTWIDSNCMKFSVPGVLDSLPLATNNEVPPSPGVASPKVVEEKSSSKNSVAGSEDCGPDGLVGEVGGEIFERHRVVFTVSTSIASVATAWAGYTIRHLHESRVEQKLESIEKAMKSNYQIEDPEFKKLVSGTVSFPSCVATAGTTLIIGDWYTSSNFQDRSPTEVAHNFSFSIVTVFVNILAGLLKH